MHTYHVLSRDGVMVDYGTVGSISDEQRARAHVKTAAEAREMLGRIGYPAMIKASEGGGGKGIRKVVREEDVEAAFRQARRPTPIPQDILNVLLTRPCVWRFHPTGHARVQVVSEVRGASVFVMKLVPNAHHLEVQVLGDQYGDAIALYSRDCSVQRRHQKIIEEVRMLPFSALLSLTH